MDFTREPIIETVITPKEGSTLAVRSSKGTGQEEYFVDAVEVVSFGNAMFFRSREKPKSFLLPVTDYEILEVREARLVLKNVGLDRSIKIAGGREAALRTTTRIPQGKGEQLEQGVTESATELQVTAPETAEANAEMRLDKKRDRRRNYKRKKGREELREEGAPKVGQEEEIPSGEPSQPAVEGASKGPSEVGSPMSTVFSSLLPPPSTLISETIARYKDNALFRGAFFIKDQEPSAELERPLDAPSEDTPMEKPLLEAPHDDEDKIELPSISLDLPTYIPPEMSEEEAERVYQERQALRLGRRGVNSGNNLEKQRLKDRQESDIEDQETARDEEKITQDGAMSGNSDDIQQPNPEDDVSDTPFDDKSTKDFTDKE